MESVLISGAAGFIGTALCERLTDNYRVIGVDNVRKPDNCGFEWEQVEITDYPAVERVCGEYTPDMVVHCAGIAHQKIGTVDAASYMRVNSKAAENLANSVYKMNPEAQFIFLSSISVYGETGLDMPVSEDAGCGPTSDHAKSKLDAEQRLVSLCERITVKNLIILRLAPVYDRGWSLNLDRRVLMPRGPGYMKFGSGQQRMSALARVNLVDFIAYILAQGTAMDEEYAIMNVSDTEAYAFNRIIQVYRESGIQASGPVIRIPLWAVYMATRVAGMIFCDKRGWLHSCYDKLASSLIFDNSRMLDTGFSPRHSLDTVFSPDR